MDCHNTEITNMSKAGMFVPPEIWDDPKYTSPLNNTQEGDHLKTMPLHNALTYNALLHSSSALLEKQVIKAALSAEGLEQPFFIPEHFLLVPPVRGPSRINTILITEERSWLRLVIDN